MKLMPDWLADMLKDEDGHFSSSRGIAVGTVVCTVFLPTIVWAWLSLWNGHMPALPDGLTGFVTAANGTALAMFAHNKRAE